MTQDCGTCLHKPMAAGRDSPADREAFFFTSRQWVRPGIPAPGSLCARNLEDPKTFYHLLIMEEI